MSSFTGYLKDVKSKIRETDVDTIRKVLQQDPPAAA